MNLLGFSILEIYIIVQLDIALYNKIDDEIGFHYNWIIDFWWTWLAVGVSSQ